MFSRGILRKSLIKYYAPADTYLGVHWQAILLKTLFHHLLHIMNIVILLRLLTKYWCTCPLKTLLALLTT